MLVVSDCDSQLLEAALIPAAAAAAAAAAVGMPGRPLQTVTSKAQKSADMRLDDSSGRFSGKGPFSDYVSPTFMHATTTHAFSLVQRFQQRAGFAHGLAGQVATTLTRLGATPGS
jgi:hypothetical protein